MKNAKNLFITLGLAMLLAVPGVAAAAERDAAEGGNSEGNAVEMREATAECVLPETVAVAQDDSLEEIVDKVKLRMEMQFPRTCAKGFYTALYKGYLSEAALYCTKGTKRSLQLVNAVFKDKFLSKLSDQDAKVEVIDVDRKDGDKNKATVKVKISSHFNIDGLFDLLHVKYDADGSDKDHTTNMQCNLVKEDGVWKVTL